VGENQQGEFICAQCKADPQRIITHLLERARSVRRDEADGDMVAIRGYCILKVLGVGGMGAVYLAQHEETGGQVALKVMVPRVGLIKKSRDTFLGIMEITKALDHPNIVRFWEAGCGEGTFFFTHVFVAVGPRITGHPDRVLMIDIRRERADEPAPATSSRIGHHVLGQASLPT
jgi:hypothetical protein